MNRTRTVHSRGDEGVSLVMALVFVVLVGLFTTVALDKSASTSLVGQQVRDRTALQYGLDAGVDRALQQLRDEMADSAPDTCTSPADADGSGTLALNGHSAAWSCRTLAGRAAVSGDPANTNYALVLTSPADGALTSQSGVSQDLQVAGSVYLRGKVVNGDVGKPIELTEGDLVSPISNNCESDLAAVTRISLVSPTGGQMRACTEQSLAQVLPTVTLPSPAPNVDISTDTALAVVRDGVQVTAGTNKCTVFFPGLYTRPPSLGNDSNNYFVSGLYYFNFSGTSSSDTKWDIDDANVRVVGGTRGSATDRPTPTTQCSAMGMSDATALALPIVAPLLAGINAHVFTYGTTWVFGGASRLEVKKGGITLMSPPAGASSVPINLVGGSSYTSAEYASQPLDTPLLVGGGNQSSMEINAKVFAPDSRVEVFSTNNTVAAARGGVVARSVQLKASAAGSDALVVSAAPSSGNPPAPFRTVVVEATDGSGATSADMRAVATISNFAPFTVNVKSWRTVS